MLQIEQKKQNYHVDHLWQNHRLLIGMIILVIGIVRICNSNIEHEKSNEENDKESAKKQIGLYRSTNW